MSRATDTPTNGSRAAERRCSPLPTAGLTLSLRPEAVSDHGAVAPIATAFIAAMQRRAFSHVRITEVPRARIDIDGTGRLALSWRGDDYHDALLEPGDAIAMLSSHHGACEIVVAAADGPTAQRHADALARALREEPPPADVVTVNFWSVEEGYPTRRPIEAPAFTDVERNYPAETRAAVARLVEATGPGAGSLLLWHGPPGTGKTHALRALARAWRGWAVTHYVTDAEQFLRRPGYLMNVATWTRDDDGDRARLIVLEDAGELMVASARAEVGQGLSRVLNLADGLLGQGVPCVLLITTNEPIGRLHPAVRRPGRCWAEIDFPPFPPEEAAAWLARRGVEHAARGATTLAELYAIAEGRELESAPPPAFGFARASEAVTK